MNFSAIILNSGIRFLDSGFRIPDSGFRIPDSGFRILDFGFRISDSGFRLPACRVAHLLTVEISSFAAGSVPNFRLSTDTALAKFVQKLNVSFTS